MADGPNLDPVPSLSPFIPLQPGYSPLNLQDFGSLPGISTLEQILSDNKKAFVPVTAAFPQLESPAAFSGVQLDVSALDGSMATYEESIWDDYLDMLKTIDEQRKVDETKSAIRNEGIQQQDTATDLRYEAEMCAAASQTMINLAVVAMLFHPASAVLPMEAKESDRALVKTMVQTVTRFLMDDKRMEGLENAIRTRVETKFADKSPQERELLIDRSFHMIRASMAFAALGAYQVANGGSTLPESIRSTVYDEGAYGHLQEHLESDLAILQDRGLLTSGQINDWLSTMTQTVLTGTRDRMGMVYSYINKVASEAGFDPEKPLQI